jgi:hypothetical protein
VSDCFCRGTSLVEWVIEYSICCCANFAKNLNEAIKAFASLTLEEKQRILSKILSVLRTTTSFVGKNKVAYNLQAIIYLAKS